MTTSHQFSSASQPTVLSRLHYADRVHIWMSPLSKGVCVQTADPQSRNPEDFMLCRLHKNPRGLTFIVVKNRTISPHDVATSAKTTVFLHQPGNALAILEKAMNKLLSDCTAAPAAHTARYSDVIISKGYHVPAEGFILGGHAKASLNYLENQFRNKYHNVGLSVNYGVVYATLDIAHAPQDNLFAVCNEEDFFSNAPKGLRLTNWGQHLLFGCTRGQTLVESVEKGLNCRVPITLSNPAVEQMKYTLNASLFSLPPGTLFTPPPPPDALTPLEMAQCIAELQAENAILTDRVRLLSLVGTQPAKAQPNVLECLDQLREMCVKLIRENAPAPVTATSGYISPQRTAMYAEHLRQHIPRSPQ